MANDSGGNGDSSSSSSTAPWAWLGLLKWTLSQTDGTVPSDPNSMSEEDRAFLEKVMEDGIIDEGERMKVILGELTTGLTKIRNAATAATATRVEDEDEDADQDDEGTTNLIEHLEGLLQELRDIVEQIDYARAFCSMRGLEFLLGCIQERRSVPVGIRSQCFGIIATLCQNNPPVQMQLLELESIRIFSELYFAEEEEEEDDEDDDRNRDITGEGAETAMVVQSQEGTRTAQSRIQSIATNAEEDHHRRRDDRRRRLLQPRILQAMSANVRNHAVAERVFSSVRQGPMILERAIDSSHESLKRRAIFFLKAIVTSDTTDRERIRAMEGSIDRVAWQLSAETNDAIHQNDNDNNGNGNGNGNNNGPSPSSPSPSSLGVELREMSLELLIQLLEQRHSVRAVLGRRDILVSRGVQRVSALRAVVGNNDDCDIQQQQQQQQQQQEKEMAKVELELWERFLTLLARAEPDHEEEAGGNGSSVGGGAPLLLGSPPPPSPEEISQTLPQ